MTFLPLFPFVSNVLRGIVAGGLPMPKSTEPIAHASLQSDHLPARWHDTLVSDTGRCHARTRVVHEAPHAPSCRLVACELARLVRLRSRRRPHGIRHRLR